VPAASGRVDTVLGYDTIGDYGTDEYFIGATVGPYANRIRDAQFALDKQTFELDANETATGHCLHGGHDGLHRQLFELERDARAGSIRCRCELADRYGGFPGNRSITVTYLLLGDHSVAIDFEVTSDRDTVISLANHAYFNLGAPIEQHVLCLHADAYTPTHVSRVPTGEVRSVVGTEFDLRTARLLGDACFDHNFIVSGYGNEPRLAAELGCDASGVRMHLYTTQVGLQLYTGDGLGAPFTPRQGLCLEAQAFPDAPNQAQFPSTRLGSGERYWQRTIYEFLV
jgi:aldose 1-epimerase